MTKVLIVDDENTYREHLSLYLSTRGHEIKAASSGREAIDVGLVYQPEVLIADWMLKNHIHGLHVSSVLQTVDINLQTVLITGFASPELRSKAKDFVFEFMEKPFTPEELETALTNALNNKKVLPKVPSTPIFKYDAAGTITYANQVAQQLVETIQASQPAHDVSGLLNELPTPGNTDWMEVIANSTPAKNYYARSRQIKENLFLLVLLPSERQQFLRNHPVVQMLLEQGETENESRPLDGRVLVVDDEELIRKFAVTIFERIGYLCHTADNHASALQTFERDSGINLVILDYDMPGQSVAEMVQKLRAIRPDVIIVGNSGGDHRRDFAAVGISNFLTKPWRIEDLSNILKKPGD